MITLALPSIGNGPFSIVVEEGSPFASITPKMYVRSGQDGLGVGNMLLIHIAVKCWEPRLVQFSKSFHLKTSIAELLNEYTLWLKVPNCGNIMKKRLISGATMLQYALSNEHSVRRAITYLAGLGFGLTPSGDDYLLGVMASLWLTGNTSPLDEIAKESQRKTTSLSANFLKAGAKGEFSESWHQLVQGIVSQDTKTAQNAISKFAQIGAYSGRDALAGFATHLIGSKFSARIDQKQNNVNGT
ncbi:MAG: DUF2877 domain-containing protein [Candidatus Neomarinimicrobiota bacterium]|nr:DUF2877 domain-containing protein [Candidatus Neomarinimicrobiota bacterium]